MADSKLYVVATPIGNLGDMVPRAIECLQSVDLIAAEDTRHAGQLCSHFDIRTSLRAYHDHNEHGVTRQLVEFMSEGHQVALISDAGMPLVSDPGYRLVKAARESGIDVTVIPGACALVVALAGSGLPSDRFMFLGFPPAKQKSRLDFYSDLSNSTLTTIVYESSHRILESLKDLSEVLGQDRQICVARELTKTFETWINGPSSEVIKIIQEDGNQTRGEFVVLIRGMTDSRDSSEAEIQRHMKLLMRELPIKKAAALTAEILGEQKKRCYDLGLAIK